MPLRYVSASLCDEQPDTYKRCATGICVVKTSKCPCEMNVEYRCRAGDCIPLQHKCDGIKHCLGGEDELGCPGQTTPLPHVEDLSVPLLAIIATLSFVTCAIICLTIFVYVNRRRKNNTSTESQSASVPLKKTCIVEVTDMYDKYDSKVRSTITIDYHDNGRYDNGYHENESKQNSRDKFRGSHGSLDSQEYKLYEKWKNNQNKFRGNIGFPQKHNEIYALELDNKNEGHSRKKGKYMFKPRLKTLEKDVCNNPDDIRLHVALNSYKQFSEKLSLPVNFDPEPETFASDLLCASTPRQPVRHIVQGSWTTNDGENVENKLVVKPNSDIEDEIL